MTISTSFTQLLDEAFRAWEHDRKRRGTQIEFARALGFPNTTVSGWMTGTVTPSDVRRVNELAAALKQLRPEFHDRLYVALGVPLPDERLAEIIAMWPSYNERQRIKLHNEALVIGASEGTDTTESSPGAGGGGHASAKGGRGGMGKND